MTYFGTLQNFALSFGREFYDIMELYRQFRDYSSPDETEIYNNNPPQNNVYSGFHPDKSYLLRQHQDRNAFNRKTRICQRGLEIRLENKQIKHEKAECEKRIQECFSRKIKSRRWMKRHHQINRSCPYISH